VTFKEKLERIYATETHMRIESFFDAGWLGYLFIDDTWCLIAETDDLEVLVDTMWAWALKR